MKYSSSVNNYRETPYIVSDTFANKGNYTATIKGAIFICRDGASLNEPSIYQANGTTWIAIGGYGIGTDATLEDVTTNGNTTDKGISITAGGLSTNSLTDTGLTAKSIPFVGTAGLITEDNTNLVWDNTNKWIGIQTNVPTAEVDIHSTTSTPAIVINNTAALASRIGFQNTNVSKWTIGNSATNTFNFYNSVLASIAAYFNGANNAAVFNGTITGNTDITAVQRLFSGTTGFFLKQNSGATTSGYTGIGTSTSGATELMYFTWSAGTQANLYFSNAATWAYIFPNANGTIALTSDLSSYVPYTGATTNVNLGVNTLTVGGNLTFGGTTTDEIITFNANNVRTGYIQASNNGTTAIFNLFADQSTTPLAFGTNGSEKMRINVGGNVLIGSTTDDTTNKLQVTGSAKVTTTVQSANFFTDNGQTSCPNATPTTISTLSSYGLYTYYVDLPVGVGSPLAYSSYAIISFDGSTARILQQTNGTGLTLTLSGNNLQATQIAGSTYLVRYVYQKIST